MKNMIASTTQPCSVIGVYDETKRISMKLEDGGMVVTGVTTQDESLLVSTIQSGELRLENGLVFAIDSTMVENGQLIAKVNLSVSQIRLSAAYTSDR